MAKRQQKRWTVGEREVLKRAVLGEVENGVSMTAALQRLGVPRATFNEWCNRDGPYKARLDRAREEGCEVIADQLLTIHDEVREVEIDGKPVRQLIDVPRAKLKSDNLRWLLARRSPKYADRLDLHVTDETPDVSGILNRRARQAAIEVRARVIDKEDSDDGQEDRLTLDEGEGDDEDNGGLW